MFRNIRKSGKISNKFSLATIFGYSFSIQHTVDIFCNIIQINLIWNLRFLSGIFGFQTILQLFFDHFFIIFKSFSVRCHILHLFFHLFLSFLADFLVEFVNSISHLLQVLAFFYQVPFALVERISISMYFFHFLSMSSLFIHFFFLAQSLVLFPFIWSHNRQWHLLLS